MVREMKSAMANGGVVFNVVYPHYRRDDLQHLNRRSFELLTQRLSVGMYSSLRRAICGMSAKTRSQPAPTATHWWPLPQSATVSVARPELMLAIVAA
jgi:hypothetical protein